MTATFHLAAQPWIPVERHDGAIIDVHLNDALTNAGAYRRIASSDPIEEYALLRLLITIASRALQQHGVDTYDRNVQFVSNKTPRAFATETETYLANWWDRFDLFGDHPFFQVPDTDSAAEPWTRLRVSTVKHLLYRTESDDPPPAAVPISQVARHLVTLQTCAIAGGSGYGSAHNNNAAHLMPYGQTLEQTIALNLVDSGSYTGAGFVPDEVANRDRPWWERDTPLSRGEIAAIKRKTPIGMFDYLTFPIRSVRLIPVESGPVSTIQFVQIAPGLLIESAGDTWAPDPWAVHVAGEKKGKAYVRARATRPAHVLWTDLVHVLSAPDGAGTGGAHGARVVERLFELAEGAPEAFDGVPIVLVATGMVIEGKKVMVSVREEFPIRVDREFASDFEDLAREAITTTERLIAALDKAAIAVAKENITDRKAAAKYGRSLGHAERTLARAREAFLASLHTFVATGDVPGARRVMAGGLRLAAREGRRTIMDAAGGGARAVRTRAKCRTLLLKPNAIVAAYEPPSDAPNEEVGTS